MSLIMSYEKKMGFFLGCSLILSVSSKLRLDSIPIGIGEVLILFFMLFSTFKHRLTYKIMDLIIIFSLLILFLIGTFISVKFGVFKVDSFLHNLIAYMFSCIFFFTFFRMLKSSIDKELLLKYIVISISLTIILYFFLSFFMPGNFYYGTSRFSGLSKNPNQLAMILSFLPFLIFRISFDKVKKLFFIILILFIGLKTLSDGLFIAWFCSFIFSVIIFSFDKSSFIIKSFFLCFGIFSLIIFIFYMSPIFIEYYNFLNSDAGQADIRVTLWMNAFEAYLYSPVFGLGPGAHSGINHPFDGSEAHNMYFDLLTNIGFFSFLLIGYFIYLIFNILKSKEYLLVTCIISLLIFSVFHLTVRHPSFWMIIAVCHVFTNKVKGFHVWNNRVLLPTK